MSRDDMTEIKKIISALDEKMVQQRSAHQSDLLRQIQILEKKFDERLDVIEKKLSTWDTAAKIGVAVFVGIGAIITWTINTLGVKIGIK